MSRVKDKVLLYKIYEDKYRGLNSTQIAQKWNISPETVRRYVRSVEFDSIAKSMSEQNSERLQTMFDTAFKVAMEAMSDIDSKTGKPSKIASDMAKTLLNTQVNKMMSTKPNEKVNTVEGDSDKSALIDDILNITTPQLDTKPNTTLGGDQS